MNKLHGRGCNGVFNSPTIEVGEGNKREIKCVVFGEENEGKELKIGLMCRYLVTANEKG